MNVMNVLPVADRQPKYIVQSAALVVGAALLVIGVLGFAVSAWTGGTSMGMFAVPPTLNAVHVVLGVLGLIASASFSKSRWYLLLGGIVWLGLASYSLYIDLAGPANVLGVNVADVWFHLVAGIVMVLFGLTLAGLHEPTFGLTGQ